MFFKNAIKNNGFILIIAFTLVAIYNWAFFKHLNAQYPFWDDHAAFYLSIALLCFCVTALVLSLLCISRVTKPILIVFVVVAAFSAYYMNVFDIAIDKTMIRNIMQTNVKEATDLFTGKLVMYALGLGFLPAFLIYKLRLPKLDWRTAFKGRATLVGLLLLVIGSQYLLFPKHYASFIREQKAIRYYLNPLTPVYSFVNYLKPKKNKASEAVNPLDKDAKLIMPDPHRELLVIVVGETARWDHFSLNGYSRPTNPLLSQEKIVNFTHVTSCGTSTSVSVPCMFSGLGRNEYTQEKFDASENLLDLLSRSGAHVLWRDNNSDDKGVAERVEYQDYKEEKLNTICDIECRDEGMLVGLQEHIDQHPQGNIAIVLHQMGSHGPAYYKRYPSAFEQFKPACQINLLERCTTEEIINAYDNTILYTDYFLAKVIELLKKNNDQFEAGMIYMGDHGESLGEKGVYLHGAPYAIAPEAQTRVGAVMWLSDSYDGISYNALKAKADLPWSHDNLFHTTLGFMEVDTKVYRPELDILKKP